MKMPSFRRRLAQFDAAMREVPPARLRRVDHGQAFADAEQARLSVGERWRIEVAKNEIRARENYNLWFTAALAEHNARNPDPRPTITLAEWSRRGEPLLPYGDHQSSTSQNR